MTPDVDLFDLQVVLSCAVSACLAEAQKEAASTDQVSLAQLDPYYSPFSPLGLPVAPGAVSATNVNVPGKFSYVVNAVHPTRPEVQQKKLIYRYNHFLDAKTMLNVLKTIMSSCFQCFFYAWNLNLHIVNF